MPAKSPVRQQQKKAADIRLHSGQAAQLLKTMGSPVRLMVLCTLVHGEYSVGELHEHLDVSQSTLSQQLAVLRKEGLVQTRREAQTIYYSLKSDKVRALTECLYELYCK